MDAKVDTKANSAGLKARLPSRHVTEGPARAPHRSYYYAMGLTKEQIHQPFVGVASCWNEAAPCNISLMRQAQAVKKGVASAGGTPREFCTITVTDGIAMGHAGMYASLPSREVIADSVELTIRGHGYDAIVGLAGCDKSLPGMMMAMVRLNVPSIFIYGGSILPGTFRGKPVTVQDMFEAVGKNSVGDLAFDNLQRVEKKQQRAIVPAQFDRIGLDAFRGKNLFQSGLARLDHVRERIVGNRGSAMIANRTGLRQKFPELNEAGNCHADA